MITMPSVFLKPDRANSLQRKHPWIFSGAIEKVHDTPNAGDTVEVFSSSGKWLARGAYSPKSQIRVRVWSFLEEEKIDQDFFRRRIIRALKYRKFLFPDEKSYRLIFGESDGIPGLIADRYENFLVTQFLSAGAEKWKKQITEILNEIISPDGIYDRSDAEIRDKEGLKKNTGLLSGNEPPEFITITESGNQFLVNIRSGHKTGFYLDQRNSRAVLSRFAKGAEVLNCFSYTGSFGVAALKAGAKKITNVDSSAEAHRIAEKNIEINSIPVGLFEKAEADVFAALRKFRSEKRKFDLIILDPPKFADSQKHLTQAARAYKDINLVAMQLLNENGLLFTFSCSGAIDASLFQKIIFDAATDAGREGVIIEKVFQSADHPVALQFPESAYLKGFLCRIF